ncbi:MAG: DUF4373 domain-containing protein [Lachnospiraceae bacterium]|nr:DUF4373 domain-containing protein [Ruminococcus sp.]MCM1277080.1 DUF4373 domain-containing protein [Lachnospiraceae bacterium]
MADGIKFVQLDCHLDEKFEYIEAEFGLEGFAIIVKLFQRIYGGQGYYCEWSYRVALLFAKRIGAGANVVQEVVASALREHIFDEEIYRKYGVLTSHGIQKRFADVAKRRAVIFDKPEYVIGSPAQNSDDVCNSAENVCNSGRNVCNESTSKVSEVKQSKVSKSAAPTAAPCFTREMLIEQYGVVNVSEYERRFDKWKAKKGGTVRGNRYETIAGMLAEDGVKKPTSSSSFDMNDEMQKIVNRYKEGQ